MNELKPCAHCGGTAVLDYRNGGLYHFVKCESCHVRTDIYANKETPAAIWNTRPDDVAVEALETADLQEILEAVGAAMDDIREHLQVVKYNLRGEMDTGDIIAKPTPPTLVHERGIKESEAVVERCRKVWLKLHHHLQNYKDNRRPIEEALAALVDKVNENADWEDGRMSVSGTFREVFDSAEELLVKLKAKGGGA